MTDEEYKIIEEHDDPEVKTALDKLQNSLSDLQEKVRQNEQRKRVNILTNYVLSDVYAIRARYIEGIIVSDEEFDQFEAAVQMLENFTNGLYKEEDQ